MREADVPAQQSEAQEDARFSRADADPRWPSRDPVAPPAGPQASRGLIWRIRDRATFEALAEARTHRAGPVRIRQVASGRDEPPRVAYAVGRPVGDAVRRNRLRRRLRAAIRQHEALLAPGHAYLVSAGPEALTMSYPALSDAVARALGAGEVERS
jgi:ribonuclease P protein component